MSSEDKDNSAADDKATGAIKRAKKLLDALAPTQPSAEEDETTAITSVVDEIYGGISLPAVSGFAAQARMAVERYRNAMRWLVGAVAAVGLILFGSVGFTEGNLEGWEPWSGLVVAAAGLVLVLGAATRVFEPEDASLGELQRDIKNKYVGKDWARLISPRLNANYNLKRILEGPEASAHLGPDNDNIKALIKALGKGQKERAEPARNVMSTRLQVADLETEREALDERLSALGTLLATEHRALDPVAARLMDAMTAVVDRMVEVDSQLEDIRADLRSRQDQLATIDQPFGVNLLHRSLVLNESGVAQLRGSFRQSRRLLFLGSVLTLVGTILYVSAIKAPDDDAELITGPTAVLPVMINIAAGELSANVSRGCIGSDLKAVVLRESIPDDSDAFTAYVSENSGCSGQYSFPPDREADAVSVTEPESD